MENNKQKIIQEALDTNWIGPLSPNISGFEEDLENYIGNIEFVRALNYCWNSFRLMILGVKKKSTLSLLDLFFNPFT